MRTVRHPPAIELSPLDKAKLNYWAGAVTAADRSLRAQIILQAAAKKSNQEIARNLDTTVHRVGRWRRAFREKGLDGLQVIGPGRKKSAERKKAAEDMIHYNAEVAPPRGGKWTPSGLAQALGLDKSLVHRALDDAGLRLPSMLFTPKNYPDIEKQVVGVVGFRCIHQRCVLALRVKAGRLYPPMAKNLHEFAMAFDRPDWTGANEDTSVNFDCKAWINFARFLDSGTKGESKVHILDTYNSRKHPEIKTWLDKHPRVQWHYVRNLHWWLDITRSAVTYLYGRTTKGTKPDLEELLGMIQKQVGADEIGSFFEWKWMYRSRKMRMTRHGGVGI